MKPKAKLTGEDGNIFVVLARARKALLDAGQSEKIKEMVESVTSSGSYEDVRSSLLFFRNLVTEEEELDHTKNIIKEKQENKK